MVKGVGGWHGQCMDPWAPFLLSATVSTWPSPVPACIRLFLCIAANIRRTNARGFLCSQILKACGCQR